MVRRQGRRYPRLKDPIAFNNPARRLVKSRSIDWMAYLTDQSSDGVAWKPRVRVEGKYVAHAMRDRRRFPGKRNEGRVCGAAQELIELMKLAPLPLPTDPLTFTCAPRAAAVKQQKPIAAWGGRIFSVKSSDPLHSSLQQFLVALTRFFRRVGPVGQEREMDMTLQAGQVMDLQRLNLLLNCCAARQHHWDRDDRSHLRRDPVAQLEGRQKRRADASGYTGVDDGYGRIECRDRAQNSQKK